MPQPRQNSMVRMFTSFIFGVTMVPSPCSISVQAIPRQPSSHARAKPTGPPPTIRTGVLCMRGLRLVGSGSLRLDARELHHLAPLLGFLGDEASEVGGRADKSQGAQIGKPAFDLRISKACVDLRVEPVDDPGGRLPGRADT